MSRHHGDIRFCASHVHSWFGLRWCTLAPGLFTVVLCGSSAFAGSNDIAPRVAIERAVRERIGPAALVTVTSLETDVAPAPGLEAVPDPGGRTGVSVRFQLVTRGTRVGTAVATVHVVAPHARAVRAIARDEALATEAWEMVTSELSD